MWRSKQGAVYIRDKFERIFLEERAKAKYAESGKRKGVLSFGSDKPIYRYKVMGEFPEERISIKVL